MTFPARFETFLHGDTHGFAEGIDQRDRRSVVIEAALSPVSHGGGDIEIPALHFRFAVRENFLGPQAHGVWRHAWRRAEGFLRAAEDYVEAFFVHVHRNGSERGDGVDDEERAEFVGDFAEAVEIGDNAGGCFTVGEADDFDFLAGSGAAHVIGINGAAEGRFDFGDVRLRARSDFKHAFGEVAVDADDGFVARLERIDDGGLDPAGAGGGLGDGGAGRKWDNLAPD